MFEMTVKNSKILNKLLFVPLPRKLTDKIVPAIRYAKGRTGISVLIAMLVSIIAQVNFIEFCVVLGFSCTIEIVARMLLDSLKELYQ